MSITRPVARPIVRPIVRGLTDLGQGNYLTTAVKALFASGEKGVMFDFTQASNLYTDSARTTLVSASGDGIGNATDLSPNAKHASSIGSARPTWNSAGYATWDAFDDYLQTAAIDFTATDAVTVVAAVRKLSDAAIGDVVELSATGTANAGTFLMLAPRANGVANYSWFSRGSASLVEAQGTSLSSPISLVATGEADISSDTCSLRVNGALVASTITDQGAGNYGNYALNIGARNAASLFFNGRIYRLLVIGRALTTTERNTAERWAAQPVGITIP